MSLTKISSSTQSIGNSLSGLSNATNRALSDLGLGGSEKGGNWVDKLRPASFRGVPFGVFESQIQFGRRVAVHEYPYRDTVWVEDLGRLGKRIAFAAFIVGGDCIEQRDRLIKACEDPAAAEGGELVHPTLGRIKVSLLDPVTCVERWDRGRMFEIGFSFLEQGERKFPTSAVSTGDAVEAAAGGAQAAAKKSFLQNAAGALKSGIATALQAYGKVQGWVRTAEKLAADATSLYHFVQSLGGDFGRLFGHGTVRSSGKAVSVGSLIAQGAVARANVATTGAAWIAATARLQEVSVSSGPLSGLPAADLLSPVSSNATAVIAAFADATYAMPAAIAAAAPTPADGLRLVSQLRGAAILPRQASALVPANPPGAVPSALQAEQAVQGSVAALLRRASAVEMVRIAGQYQPTSRADAQAVQALVLEPLDEEISLAGELGDDEVFNALRTLRTAIVQDLAARSVNLAATVTVEVPAALPAPVLAQRLYRDATRADELVAAAEPIHPAFMPRAFNALAR
jgi:prophage DNA circulation protein